ncbi:TolC family protein [Croceiramulus getboli]|nr:TolC family protein [Flavobacteriaceae bacterium YJPT1-3]
MKHLLYLLVVVLAFAKAEAQEPMPQQRYSFNLEEAIAFAIDSNYTAINARRDIAKALKQKWETTATGLPQINANIDYQNQLKQPVTLIPGELTGGEPGTFVPVVFGVQQSANLTATLSQLIFDGSYLVALQASAAFLRFSDNAAEKTALEVRKGVINAYGGVLLTQENIRILEKNIETLEKNLFETRKIYENGLAEEEDVEQLQITSSQLQNQLNNARRQEEIAKQMLNLALGIPVETLVLLEDDLEALAMENITLSLMDQNLNYEENIDYKIAYNLTEQRELEAKLEKSKALPTLSGFINYGTSAFDDEFVFFDSDTRWFQSSIVGVNMSIPIFSSLQRTARTQRAEIALDQAQTDLEQTIQEINLSLNTARSDYRFAIENYETSKRNLQLAERIENKNQIKFTEGIGSSFDLRQAQVQLYTAQQELLQAMLNVIQAKAELETILNLPNLNITIQN